jgi:hypothetical protein
MAKMTTSDMYCTQCGEKGIPIQRRIGKEREPGHLKKMYCINCKKAVNMVEVKNIGSKYTYEDFKLEFENGYFDTEGKRKLPLSEFKQMMYKKEKANE